MILGKKIFQLYEAKNAVIAYRRLKSLSCCCCFIIAKTVRVFVLFKMVKARITFNLYLSKVILARITKTL